jgi:streptogramin lyase
MPKPLTAAGLVVGITAILAPLALAAIGDPLAAFPTPTSFPTDIAVHRGALWIAGWEDGTLTEVDPDSGQVKQTLPAPCFHPEGLASDGDHLYVSDYETHRVYVFDPASGQTLESYPAPGDSPRGLAYGNGSLWLIDDGEDTIYEMVPGDGTILNYYKAPQGNGRGLCHDGTHLWVTDRARDELYAVRPSDGKVIFLVKTDAKFPCGLAFADGALWLADFQDKKIERLRVKADAPYRVTDEVVRDFRFRHTLRNDGEGTIAEAAINIAVPYPRLENQEILGETSWTAQPDELVQDRWGQDVAVFRYRDIAPGQRASAGYRVRVRLGEIHYAFYPEDVGRLDEIPKDVRGRDLAPTSRLQMDRDEVRKTAAEIVGDEKNPYWIARKIFDWVNDKLEYQLVGGWDVPTTLIKRGTGSCSEYAFLYIALCRSAGLPARYEGSVVVRGDDASMDEVYHRWCEVYLPRIGWMPVDPSGGDQQWPADQARYFGGLANRFLITTHGGGDSKYLGWDYNSHATYVYDGRGTVHEEAYGVWSPVTDAQEATSAAGAEGCGP